MRGKHDAERLRNEIARHLDQARGAAAFTAELQKEHADSPQEARDHYAARVAEATALVDKLERDVAAFDRVIARWESTPGLPQGEPPKPATGRLGGKPDWPPKEG